MVFHSHSPAETEEFAARLARRLPPGCVLALTGGLGAGKTAFVRGLARGLGFSGEVSSPTFALVHEYPGGRLPLYHFDMYRVDSWDSLYSTGFFDYLEQPAVLAAEWSENIEAALPERRVRVDIQPGDTTEERVITVTPMGGFELEDFGA